MPPQNRTSSYTNLSEPKNAKNTSFNIVLSAIKKELKRDYRFYEEALLGVIQAEAWGGDSSPWLHQMDDVVKGNLFAEMSHEGVKFLIKEMVRDYVAEGYKVPGSKHL